jgi:hypothetical protein
VLVPSQLSYGGGWLPYGYPYFLDSPPFVTALCGIAAARRGGGRTWRPLITAGLVVNLIGINWAYSLGESVGSCAGRVRRRSTRCRTGSSRPRSGGSTHNAAVNVRR